MEKYNPKIDYLLAKFTNSSYTGAIDEQEWKLVYNELLAPQNAEQECMLRIKKAITYIKSTSDFNVNAISTIYNIVADNSNLDIGRIELLIEEVLSSKEFAPVHAYFKVIKEKLFYSHNYEMAILLHTMLRLKEEKLPIVFFPLDAKKINQMIEDGFSFEQVIAKIAMVSYKTLQCNIPHNLITREEITSKILSLQNILLERYGVISLSIYGSYARNEENVYSDLDIYAEVRDDKKADLSNKYKLFAFLKKELGICVEGKVKDDEYKELRVDMIRDLVTLF